MSRYIRLEAKHGWRGLIPPVVEESPSRIARQSSNAKPQEAVWLIALLTKNHIVVVRNAYEVPSNGGIYVENIGAMVPRMTTKAGSSDGVLNRTLKRCLGRMRLYKGPFKVSEPSPNFMLDLRVKDFDAAYAAALKIPGREDLLRLSKHGHSALRATTPMEDLLELYRTEAGVYAWTPARVRSLAAMIGVTTDELASLAECPRGLMDAFLTTDVAHLLPNSVRLWLFFLEQFFAHARMGKTPISAFPAEVLNDRLRSSQSVRHEQRAAAERPV